MKLKKLLKKLSEHYSLFLFSLTIMNIVISLQSIYHPWD